MITEKNFSINSKYDAVLIGAGIMSATLALLISEIWPSCIDPIVGTKIIFFEFNLLLASKKSSIL